MISRPQKERYSRDTAPSRKKYENGGEKWFTSDPVPELEHVGLVDAELFHLRRVGGQCGKVLGHVRFLMISRKRLNK